MLTCKMCGNGFIPHHPRQTTFCSRECLKAHRKAEAHKKWVENKAEISAVAKEKRRTEHKTQCIFCGDWVFGEFNGVKFTRKHYHRDCLVDCIKNQIRDYQEIAPNIYRKAKTSGINVSELREEVKNERREKLTQVRIH